MLILAFESSCDETAASVTLDGRTVLADEIYSQADMHAIYGGVVGQFVPLAHTTYREGVITPVGIVVGPRGGRVFYATKGDTYKYDHLWSSNADMRPFNMYAGGGVAVQLGDIQIMVGYDHSLLNVSRIEGERTGRSQIKVGVNFTIGED